MLDYLKIDFVMNPLNDRLSKFLILFFKTIYSDYIFLFFLKFFFNRRLPQYVVIISEPFLFKKNMAASIYDIYLQSLRALNLNHLCIDNSNKVIELFPLSDVGYWHAIHAYNSLGDNDKVFYLQRLFKKKNINSDRFTSLCIGNKIIEKRFNSIGINKSKKEFNLFFSDSGLFGYTLLKFKSSLKNVNDSDFVIFISCHGGFSNLLAAVLNAIGLAKLLKIKNVYLIKTKLSEKFFSNKLNFGDILIKLTDQEPEDNYISGTFFSHLKFLEIFEPNFRNHRLDYARKIMKINARSISFSDRDLVIHIRSGDIFGNQKFYNKYGQPPLSFYILCIRDFNPSSVTLIYEDKKNPVIDLLINFLRDIGCPIKRPNFRGIKEDISYIYNAKNVVCGNGTFVLGILLGSIKLKNLYIFEANEECKKNWALDRQINLNNIVDANGIYSKNLLNKNWMKSSFQFWLMQNYPIKNLKILRN